MNDLKHGEGVINYGDGRTARLMWNQGTVVPKHSAHKTESRAGMGPKQDHTQRKGSISRRNEVRSRGTRKSTGG